MTSNSPSLMASSDIRNCGVLSYSEPDNAISLKHVPDSRLMKSKSNLTESDATFSAVCGSLGRYQQAIAKYKDL
jgi:hypothetical protein